MMDEGEQNYKKVLDSHKDIEKNCKKKVFLKRSCDSLNLYVIIGENGYLNIN